jgi:hypothetical protein
MDAGNYANQDLKKIDDILRELYADTLSDVSVNSDNDVLDSDSDITTTSSRKQLRSTGSVTSQFPHPFFLTSITTIFKS